MGLRLPDRGENTPPGDRCGLRPGRVPVAWSGARSCITLMRQVRFRGPCGESHGPVAADTRIYVTPVFQPCAGLHGPVAFHGKSCITVRRARRAAACTPPPLPGQVPSSHEHRSPRYPSILDSPTDKFGISGVCRKEYLEDDSGTLGHSRALNSSRRTARKAMAYSSSAEPGPGTGPIS